MRNFQLDQTFANDFAKRGRFVPVKDNRFHGFFGCFGVCIQFIPFAHPAEHAETRSHGHNRRPRNQRRHFILPRPVVFVQILNDIVRLVHFNSGVFVNQIRKLRLASSFLDKFAKSFPALRTRIDDGIQIEPHDSLSHFATERAPFKLVQFERFFWTFERFRVARFFQVSPAEGPERILSIRRWSLFQRRFPALRQDATD
mmetsp:Transcript_3033/g.9346  ORF Transcript_3033/g.9346 Transcript_3033/m.9346 type:complete len:200 (-) Transcript_3033:187-786(-)